MPCCSGVRGYRSAAAPVSVWFAITAVCLASMMWLSLECGGQITGTSLIGDDELRKSPHAEQSMRYSRAGGKSVELAIWCVDRNGQLRGRSHNRRIP